MFWNKQGKEHTQLYIISTLTSRDTLRRILFHFNWCLQQIFMDGKETEGQKLADCVTKLSKHAHCKHKRFFFSTVSNSDQSHPRLTLLPCFFSVEKLTLASHPLRKLPYHANCYLGCQSWRFQGKKPITRQDHVHAPPLSRNGGGSHRVGVLLM